MAYKGRYRVKNKKKYKGDASEVVYRSLWERYCFRWADQSSFVKRWSSEEIVVPYLYEGDGAWHRYFVDLWLELENGKILLVEIKPFRETVEPKPPSGNNKSPKFLKEILTYTKNTNKWDAAREYAKKKGWEFTVWTEKELTEMGILPKSTKPLKRGPWKKQSPVPPMKTKKKYKNKPFPPYQNKKKPL